MTGPRTRGTFGDDPVEQAVWEWRGSRHRIRLGGKEIQLERRLR